jgi:hypothetical protein
LKLQWNFANKKTVSKSHQSLNLSKSQNTQTKQKKQPTTKHVIQFLHHHHNHHHHQIEKPQQKCKQKHIKIYNQKTPN